MKNETKKINLVLQGGGIKGLAYIGALRYLEEKNYQVNYVSGSSVGAIIASLIAVGYDSFELEKIINEVPIDIFMKKNNIRNSIKNKGLYSLKELELYLEKLYLNKGKRYFRDIKIGNNYKAIFISTSLEMKRIFVLPYDLKLININPDDFPIAKAVIMSCSIPFFYEPVVVNNYKFYDGGVSDNFPKWCFSNALALKFEDEKKYIRNIKKSFFGTIENDNEVNEVYIDTREYKTTDFKKGFKEKNCLYKKGYLSLKNYFLYNKND